MPFSDRLPSLQRYLGLEGFVVLAALLGDLLIILPAAFDDAGPRGRDLLLLPGIFAMVLCALWGRRNAVQATFVAAVVLVASTAGIRYADVTPYSTLLNEISLAETVAGLELVYFCARWARPWFATTAISTLVAATLVAVAGREDGGPRSDRFLESLLIGLVLLAAAVAVGIQFRVRRPAQQPQSAVGKLFRDQWPLIGVLCLPLFLELPQAMDQTPRSFPLLLCSLASAVVAVLSTRFPVRAGLLLSGLFVLSIAGYQIAPRYQDFGTLPITQIAAGLIVVVFLVRNGPTRQSWLTIGLMSFTVALASLANVRVGREGLAQLVFGAALLLGLAIAIGLYFRARDSERAKIVEAAVTDAQTSERMALARELHDVVAHHVTGIVVQAQAAKLMGGKNPQLAMDALDSIEAAGTEALVAMRRLVRSMRSNASATEQATMDLEADLRQLIETAHHGVRTEADLRLPRDIPQEVARSALRLVQESLTNIGKHAAGATRVEVLAEVVETELHIRVSDDGRAAVGKPAGGSGGYGLVGMRERVELLHGSLTAGPVDGGWLVDAWLPLQGEAE